MKLGQLVSSKDALAHIASVELEATKSYEMVAFLNEVNKHLEVFEKARNKRITELGEEVDGKTMVKDSNIEKFVAEIEKLLDTDVEVTVPELTLDDLKGVKVKTADMALLADWMIKKTTPPTA